MKLFYKIPVYSGNQDRGLNWDKVIDHYVNKFQIVSIGRQFNSIRNIEGSFFYTTDGGEFYCPLTVEALLSILNED